MIELKRRTRFEIEPGIISEFQLPIENRFRKIESINSEDGKEFKKYNYTEMSGYITIFGDVEKIFVSFE